MKRYKVWWMTTIYGLSTVDANNEEEAYIKAENNEDVDFERFDEDVDWEIVEITDSDKENKKGV